MNGVGTCRGEKPPDREDLAYVAEGLVFVSRNAIVLDLLMHPALPRNVTARSTIQTA